jgi:hypothetical protein
MASVAELQKAVRDSGLYPIDNQNATIKGAQFPSKDSDDDLSDSDVMAEFQIDDAESLKTSKLQRRLSKHWPDPIRVDTTVSMEPKNGKPGAIIYARVVRSRPGTPALSPLNTPRKVNYVDSPTLRKRKNHKKGTNNDDLSDDSDDDNDDNNNSRRSPSRTCIDCSRHGKVVLRIAIAVLIVAAYWLLSQYAVDFVRYYHHT